MSDATVSDATVSDATVPDATVPVATVPVATVPVADVSVVIATLDEGDELTHTVLSLLAGTVVPSEIVVVDDGGTDPVPSTLCGHGGTGSTRVIVHTTERHGIAGARNIGAALSTGARVLFLDAHCRVAHDWLRRLIEASDAHPGSIVVPAIADMPADEHPPRGNCASDVVHGCGARLIDADLRIRWLAPGERTDGRAGIAPGGCLLMRRDVWEHLGSFGAFRELGLEDVELSLRAWRLGVDIVCAPTATMTHRFRTHPHYALRGTSRGYNAANVALVHFIGARRDACLRRLIGTTRATEVVLDALAGDWEKTRAALDVRAVRDVDTWFTTFGDW